MRNWALSHGWPILRKTAVEWSEDDGLMLAAAVAYYAAFSFFPLLLVLLSGIGVVLKVSESAQNEQAAIIESISQSTSEAFAQQIDDLIEGVAQQAPLSGPLGLLVLLFGAIGLFAQIDSAMDRIWKVKTPHAHGILQFLHRVLIDRLKAFVMLLGLGGFITASFVVGMILSALAGMTDQTPLMKLGWHVARFASIVAINTALFTIMFKTIPQARIRWLEALPGGLLTAVIWEVGRQVLSLFVIGTRYSAYGVVGTFIAMMVWAYYASSVLFLGAEFVKVTGDHFREKRAAAQVPPC
jgi:membrane protein